MKGKLPRAQHKANRDGGKLDCHGYSLCYTRLGIEIGGWQGFFSGCDHTDDRAEEGAAFTEPASSLSCSQVLQGSDNARSLVRAEGQQILVPRNQEIRFRKSGTLKTRTISARHGWLPDQWKLLRHPKLPSLQNHTTPTS